MGKNSSDPNKPFQPDHIHRDAAVRGRAVAQLAIEIVSPAQDSVLDG
jgi:hypothetical protein